jgi:Ca2+-binding EF-hand superfamily protein
MVMVAALGLAGISTAFGLLKLLQRQGSSSSQAPSSSTQDSAATGQNVPTGASAPASFDPAALFASLDTDKSGGIDKNELLAGLKNARGGSSGSRSGGAFDSSTFGALLSVQEASQKSSRADKLFSKLDTDGNNTISADELTAALTGGKQTDASKDGLASIFSSMDSNKDGTISADEFKAAMEKAATQGHRRHHHHDRTDPSTTATAATDTGTTTDAATTAATTGATTTTTPSAAA